jgi:hypothetical protein
MLSGFMHKFHSVFAVLLLCLGLPTIAFAGAKIKIDDTKWFSIGLGFRSSFAITEDGAPNGTDPSSGVSFDNIRLYTAGQVHENVTLEFNTERSDGDRTTSADDNTNLSTNNQIRVLDAVAKFSIKGFDVWAGRFLPPSDRSNLDGPFYLNVYDFPVVQAYPAIFAGRDNGVAIMHEYAGGKFKWSYGLFEGRTNSTNSDTNPDQSDNLLHAARVTYNFWDPEPGYYTTSSYYGAKDVLAVAFVYQHENDGAGTSTTAADFTGWNVDAFMEKKLGNGGVVNIEGAYYDYDLDNATDTSLTQGVGYLALSSYLIPKQIGWGKLQPYVRYQHFARDTVTGDGGNRTVTEGGLNYIIDGQNAKINVVYSADRNGSNADTKNTFKIGLQFQL